MVSFKVEASYTETLDAAKKLVFLIGADLMGSRMEISRGGRISVELESYAYDYKIEAQNTLIEGLARILKVVKLDSRRRLYRNRHRRRPAVDIVESQFDLDGVLITISHIKLHEHGELYGEVLKDGKPRWLCRSCRKPITVTECRKLGLLPKLERKKS